jgi:methionyl-tRNA formyltransferase
MQPWPTAYTYWHHSGHPPQRILINRATWQDSAGGKPRKPGQVFVPDQGGPRLLVAAGSGSQVEILELQPAGKRRMPAAEFLRGHRPQADDWLGPEMP